MNRHVEFTVERFDLRAMPAPPSTKLVDLSAVVPDVADLFERVIEDAGRQPVVTVNGAARAAGDVDLLRRAVLHRAEKAIAHSPLGGTIRVTTSLAPGGRPRIAVADDGPGMPATVRARAPEPFYRTVASRITPGHAGPRIRPGPASVAAVAQRHGARLDFDSMEPGLAVTIEFAAA